MKLLPAIGLLLVTPVIHAQPGVETSLAYFNYHESSATGQILNRESGWLPQLRFMWNVERQDHAFSVAAAYMGGEVDYHGQTQLGSELNTATKQSIHNVSAQWQWSFLSDLAVITGWQHFWWRRDIQPQGAVVGLTEDYAWSILEAGLQGRYAGWQAELLWNRSLQSVMVVQPTPCASRVELQPEPGNGYSIDLSHPLWSDSAQSGGQNWRWYLRHQVYRMAESSPQPGASCVGTLSWREPDNQLQLSQVGVQLRF